MIIRHLSPGTQLSEESAHCRGESSQTPFKSNGGRRPLGIPPIRDRVVQMAAHLVLSPIFEADLPPQQYGFRPGLCKRPGFDPEWGAAMEHRVRTGVTGGGFEIVEPPENPAGDMVSSCSLVGLHAWASVLHQMGHPSTAR